MTTKPTDRSTLQLALLLAAVTGVQGFATVAMLAVAVIAPAVAVSLKVSPALVGLHISVIYIVAAMTSGQAGAMVRRLGAVRISQISLVLCGAGCALVLLGNLVAVFFASLVIGLGYGLTNPSAGHLLFRFTPDRRRNLVFSIKQTGVPLGGIIAGFLLPAISEGFGWPAALASVTVMCLAGALSLQPLRKGWDDDRDPGVSLRTSLTEAPRTIWKLKPLRYLALAAFCFQGLQLSLLTFIVTMLVVDLGYSLVLAGSLAAMVHASGAVGRLAWGWLADRVGDGFLVLRLLGVTIALFSLTTGLMTAGWPLPLVALFLTGFGFAAVGWNGVFMAEIARLAPAGGVGTAIGGVLMISFVGVVVAPSAFSVLHGVIDSYTHTFAAMAGLMAIGITMLTLAVRASAKPVAAAGTRTGT